MLKQFCANAVLLGDFVIHADTVEGTVFVTQGCVGTSVTAGCVDQSVAQIVATFDFRASNRVDGTRVCAQTVFQVDVGFVVVKLTAQYEATEVVV